MASDEKYGSSGQICRVEDVDIYGEVSGSVVHIQRARNVTISREGVLSASGLGAHAISSHKLLAFRTVCRELYFWMWRA